MSDQVIVFLGPSCPHEIACDALQAVYRGPATRGDLLRAARDGARIIVLIDGVMVYGYPPSPTEVYQVLQSGVSVYGAASLGALRGVELRYHGMSASGWVFDAYLNGLVDHDDEVLTPFDPRTGVPLAVPLIRVRYAITRLVDLGELSPTVGRDLMQAMRRLHFEERTNVAILEVLRTSDVPEHIHDRLLAPEFDIKRRDTIECLHRVAWALG